MRGPQRKFSRPSETFLTLQHVALVAVQAQRLRCRLRSRPTKSRTAPTKQASATEGQLPPWSLCWPVLGVPGLSCCMEQRRRKDGATQDLHECILRISMALPAVRPAFFCGLCLSLPSLAEILQNIFHSSSRHCETAISDKTKRKKK